MASMTITTDNAQALRLATAVGRALLLKDAQGVLRPATNAEVKVFTIQFLRDTVRQQEQNAAREAVALPNDPFDPS